MATLLSQTKFDVVIGINCPTRIAQSLTREQLDTWCAESGYKVADVRRIGVVYHEARVERA